MRARIAIVLIAAGVAASTVTTPAAISDPVKTDAGLVAGETLASGVRVFKGIPFGAPPTGSLRWREPQPVAKWDGVREAKTWGNVCVQPNQPNRQPVNVTVDLPDSPKMSEDCLYLNVWTQANRASDRRPVMLWIFGGAYSEGGGSTPHNNGENLAKKGVLLVTFNYRLGIFGFYAHPELTKESGRNASGNQALSDAIAAMRWIKANIANFGGDPNNVTIFGESAGAAIVGMLAGSPVAKGLFHRAITESGGWMGLGMAQMTPRERAEQTAGPRGRGAGGRGGQGRGGPGGPGAGGPPPAGGAAAAPQAPPAAPPAPATPPPLPSLAELRARTTEEIRTMGLGGGQPIIDGWIIPEDLSITFANGKQNQVDVIAGYNKDEHTGFGGAANTNTAQRDAMAWHARIFAEKQTQIGRKAYVYTFTHEPPVEPPAPNLRATHAAEMVYVFNNLHAPRMIPDRSSPRLAMESPKDRAIAEQMSSYWVNFAKSGDPNGKDSTGKTLPKWERFKDRNAAPHFIGESREWPGADVLNQLDEAYVQKVLTPLGIKK
jgi:para-nitrobenzyl esterase